MGFVTSFIKQTILTLVLAAVALVVWLRTDETAQARIGQFGLDAARLEQVGLPPDLLARIAVWPEQPVPAQQADARPQGQGGAGQGSAGGAQAGRPQQGQAPSAGGVQRPGGQGQQAAGQGGGQGQRGGGGGPGGGFGGRGETLVVAQKVTTASINDRLSAIGDGEAVRSVAVVPLVSGMLIEVAVTAGDKVEPGQVLARIDDEAERIARDRAELQLRNAEEKTGRLERLVRSRTATEVQLTDARNEVAAAKLALRDADLALKRRVIDAPIAGTVGIVPVEKGDYVTTQTEILTIDDRSGILVDFWIPERFAGLVAIGSPVEAEAISLPGAMFTGAVEAIGGRVDRDSRTLQIRARLDNPRDTLRAGMSFRVGMRFSGQSYPAVDPLAIQWSSDGAFVWRVVDGAANKVSVHIIQRNSDAVLVDGEIGEGDLVVTEGVQTLRPGAKVKIVGDNAPPATASIDRAGGAPAQTEGDGAGASGQGRPAGASGNRGGGGG